MFLCLSGLGHCCGFLIHYGHLLLCSGGLQSRLIQSCISCQLCSGGTRLHLLHHGRFLLRSGVLLSHLIHHGGCQLCSGGLQFHSGSMLHWLCISPLSPHEQGLPTLHILHLFRPRSITRLYCFMESTWKPLLGEGLCHSWSLGSPPEVAKHIHTTWTLS